MDKMRLVAVAVILLAAPALGVRYCATTDDCSGLGDLKCIYSMCLSKGICGCDRSMVAKWMGSTRLFQCVPLRKVGQRCSNIETTGACGAPNSYCNEAKNTASEWEGWCQCASGYLPVYDGELCISYMANPLSESVDGETCQADGKCNDGAIGNCPTTSSNLYTQVRGHQYSCACQKTQKLILDYSASTPFTDRLEPKCVDRVLGDKCKADSECGSGPGPYPNSQCLNGTCQCDAGYTQNYYGSACINNTVKLGLGGNCTQDQGLCDGAAGLVCGDECAWLEESDKKCQCGRGHTGHSCKKVEIGDDCVGDDNCNVYNNLAICVDGVCVDGTTFIPTNLKTLDEENAAGAMYVTWSLLAAAIISRFL